MGSQMFPSPFPDSLESMKGAVHCNLGSSCDHIPNIFTLLLSVIYKFQ